MRIILFGILSCLLAFGAEAQVKFSAKLSKDSVFVGQPTELKLALKIESPADSSTVEWLLPVDSIASGLEILKNGVTYHADGIPVLFDREILISAEEIGFYPIPPIRVKVKGKIYESQALLLNVFSTIQNPDQEEIRDFKESSQVTYGLVDFLIDNWIWILIGVLVLGILVFITIQLRKKEPKPEVIPELEAIKIPAIEVALEKFNYLDKQNLWQTGQLKEYHTNISYILREYLEDELEISALESPTSDILKSLRRFHLDSDLTQKIKVSLSLTDLVKFAKQKPTESENRRVLEDAKNAVMQINKNFISKD